jgi:hypothetical protein
MQPVEVAEREHRLVPAGRRVVGEVDGGHSQGSGLTAQGSGLRAQAFLP